jgi:hypothetical protein
VSTVGDPQAQPRSRGPATAAPRGRVLHEDADVSAAVELRPVEDEPLVDTRAPRRPGPGELGRRAAYWTR